MALKAVFWVTKQPFRFFPANAGSGEMMGMKPGASPLRKAIVYYLFPALLLIPPAICRAQGVVNISNPGWVTDSIQEKEWKIGSGISLVQYQQCFDTNGKVIWFRGDRQPLLRTNTPELTWRRYTNVQAGSLRFKVRASTWQIVILAGFAAVSVGMLLFTIGSWFTRDRKEVIATAAKF